MQHPPFFLNLTEEALAHEMAQITITPPEDVTVVHDGEFPYEQPDVYGALDGVPHQPQAPLTREERLRELREVISKEREWILRRQTESRHVRQALNAGMRAIENDYLSSVPHYNRKPTVHPFEASHRHPQLRDVICCPEGDRAVYFPQGGANNRVMRLNLETEEIEEVLVVGFDILTLKVHKNFLAVGGHSSDLIVYDLATNSKIFDRRIGGSMNNSFWFHYVGDAQDELRLIVNNNTHIESIRVFRLPSCELVTSFSAPHDQQSTRINHSSVSPDQKWLCAVGDLAEITPQGHYNLVESHPIEKGDCHMCTWSPDGKYFAVACEGVRVREFPAVGATAYKPCAARPTTLDPVASAVRLVKFSPRPFNFCVFAEDMNFIHVVSLHPPYKEQVLAVPSRSENLKATFPHIGANKETRTPERLFFDRGDIQIAGLDISPATGKIIVSLADHDTETHGCILTFEPFGVPTLVETCLRTIRQKKAFFSKIEDWSAVLPAELVARLNETGPFSVEAEDEEKIRQKEDQDTKEQLYAMARVIVHRASPHMAANDPPITAEELLEPQPLERTFTSAAPPSTSPGTMPSLASLGFIPFEAPLGEVATSPLPPPPDDEVLVFNMRSPYGSPQQTE